MGTEWALEAGVDRGVGTDFPYFPSRRLSDCGRRYRALALWLSGWTALCCVCVCGHGQSCPAPGQPFAGEGALFLPSSMGGVDAWPVLFFFFFFLLVPQPSTELGRTALRCAAHSLVCSGCAHFSRSVAAPQDQRNNPAPKTR